MNKRNYKELWGQLKVVVMCGSRKRWSRRDIYDAMISLETYQATKEPSKK